MIFEERQYQVQNTSDIYGAWDAGYLNVLDVLPTGGGKTHIFTGIVRDHDGRSCTIAHRQELVFQISLALGQFGVKHQIIAPKAIVQLCVRQQLELIGQNFINTNAPTAVAGVNTLLSRKNELSQWAKGNTLWVQDECHHLLKENMWGKAIAMFPNAKGLGVTATPLRADGKGLGAWNDGVFHTMVQGPTMRDLIDHEGKYLTEFKIFAPPSHMIMDEDDVSQVTGDFKRTAVVKKFRKNKNKIIGNIVDHYKKHANNKLGIAFLPDIEDAIDTAKAFNLDGIPAAAISSKTKNIDRINLLRKFKNREILMLVNVDLFGEGFDLPAIEVVVMARPTQSYALFVQQFGRALRKMPGKKFAIIIDHVGNVERMAMRYGLPDTPPQWSLERRQKRGKNKVTDKIPQTVCPKCHLQRSAIFKICPECGHVLVPGDRSKPEFVDGDLIELSAEALQAMRNQISKVDMTPMEFKADCQSRYVAPEFIQSHIKNHMHRQDAVNALRGAIDWWGAFQRSAGRDDSESYRRFYFMFGIDIGTAQYSLSKAETLLLAERVCFKLGEMTG